MVVERVVQRIKKRKNEGFYFKKNWLDKPQADSLFSELLKLPWQQEALFLYGRWHTMPRKVLWVGEAGICYTYAKKKHQAKEWPKCLKPLVKRLQDNESCFFNGALLNYYVSGEHYMGWHSDNEAELGVKPDIASLSLGESRRFLIRNKKTKEKHEFLLDHGSLLFMKGKSQEDWEHSLPKMLRVSKPRINITFRKILSC